MPTAAKLVAAAIFALTGYFAAEILKAGGPEGESYGWFTSIAAAVGLFTGWTVSGRYAGRGYFNSLGFGLRSSIQLTVSVMLVCGTVMMLERAYDRRYPDVVQAFIGILEAMWELLPRVVARPDVLTVLILGGIVGGYCTERAARRWS